MLFKEPWKQELWEAIIDNVQAQKRLQTAIDFSDDTVWYQNELSVANMKLFGFIESLPSEFKNEQ